MSTTTLTQHCPICGTEVTAEPYNVGSGLEMCCPTCEMCWGAEGQALQPLPRATRASLIAQGYDEANLPEWLS